MSSEVAIMSPRTLQEALQILSASVEPITPVAGGTNVVVERRARHGGSTALMNLGKIPELKGIRVENGYVIVGGGTTIAELLSDPIIERHGGPLREAALHFANPLIRNRATVAGNLVDASPAADTAPSLLSLDAEVVLASSTGQRIIPLDQFLVGVRKTLRNPKELVVSIRWPVPDARSASGSYKIGLRRGTACAVISAAVTVTFAADGTVRRARIALGSVAIRPVRAYDAEDSLTGKHLLPETIQATGHLASQAAHPIDDIRGSAAYRRKMAAVLVRRLLTRCAQNPAE